MLRGAADQHFTHRSPPHVPLEDREVRPTLRQVVSQQVLAQRRERGAQAGVVNMPRDCPGIASGKDCYALLECSRNCGAVTPVDVGYRPVNCRPRVIRQHRVDEVVAVVDIDPIASGAPGPPLRTDASRGLACPGLRPEIHRMMPDPRDGRPGGIAARLEEREHGTGGGIIGQGPVRPTGVGDVECEPGHECEICHHVVGLRAHDRRWIGAGIERAYGRDERVDQVPREQMIGVVLAWPVQMVERAARIVRVEHGDIHRHRNSGGRRGRCGMTHSAAPRNRRIPALASAARCRSAFIRRRMIMPGYIRKSPSPRARTGATPARPRSTARSRRG